MSVVELPVPVPDAPAALIVDIKRNGALRARMEQIGTAWGLQMFDPDWTILCDDIVEAWGQYETTCHLAGIHPEVGNGHLTVIEFKHRPNRDGGAPRKQRSGGARLLAQIVSQVDNHWELSVYHPDAWNRMCGTIREAFQEFESYMEPHAERGPVGGR